MKYLGNSLLGSKALLRLPKSGLLAYFRNGVDTIGVSTILFQSGDVSTWATTAVWGFEYNVTMATVDTALGGLVLFNADTSTIYRTYAEWFALAETNADYLWLGVRGIAAYSTDQTANAERIRRYLGSDPLKSDVLLPFFWDMSQPQVGIKGPDPEWSYAGALPDGNGGTDSSGDPVVHSEGLWCGPAYTNAAPSIRADITTWTQRGTGVVSNGDGSYRVTLGTKTTKDLYYSGGGYADPHTLSIDVKRVAGATTLFFADSSTPIGTTEHTVGDNWQSLGITVPALGQGHHFYANSGEITVDLRFPQAVEQEYFFPYIYPATSVVSAASSIGGNGLNVPMDAAMLSALSGSCTLAALMTMGVGSDELDDGDSFNIYSSSNGESAPLAYGKDSTGSYFAISDGTNTSKIYAAWSRNDVVICQGGTDVDGTQMRVGYLNVTNSETVFTYSSWGAFSGTFGPLTYFRLGLNNTAPQWDRQVQLWSTGEVSEAEILRLAERYGHA